MNVLNLGCGNQTYGTHRVDIRPTPSTTHVFDIEKGIQFPNDFFDAVYSRNLLEHIRNVGFLLEECHRVLKKGGTIDITTDNAECTRFYLFGTHTGRYEKIHPGDKHYSIFTESHLNNHFEAAGFKNIQIECVKTDTSGRFIDMIVRQKPRLRVTATK